MVLFESVTFFTRQDTGFGGGDGFYGIENIDSFIFILNQLHEMHLWNNLDSDFILIALTI